jgi:hypothetical protein
MLDTQDCLQYESCLFHGETDRMELGQVTAECDVEEVASRSYSTRMEWLRDVAQEVGNPLQRHRTCYV